MDLAIGLVAVEIGRHQACSALPDAPVSPDRRPPFRMLRCVLRHARRLRT